MLDKSNILDEELYELLNKIEVPNIFSQRVCSFMQFHFFLYIYYKLNKICGLYIKWNLIAVLIFNVSMHAK